VGAHPVQGTRVPHHQPAPIVLEEPAEAVRPQVGVGKDPLVVQPRADGGLRGAHLTDRAVRQEPPTAVVALAELQAEPLRHIAHRGNDRARAADVVEVAPRDGGHGTLDPAVRCRQVAHRLQAAHARPGALHSQRLEDPGPQELVPARVRDRLHEFARRQEHDVLVSVGGSEAGRRLEQTDATQHFGPVERGRVPQRVTARQAAAVGEQVPHPHFAARVRIGQLEARENVGHAVVPMEPALVHEHRQGGGGECLGGRCDREERLGVHRLAPADLPHAVAPLEHDGIVLDHGHGDARRLPVPQDPLDVSVQSGERRILRRGGMRDEQEGDGHQRADGGSGHGRAPFEGEDAPAAEVCPVRRGTGPRRARAG
jgi:hypothetical protein